jgi:hypothetical protein
LQKKSVWRGVKEKDERDQVKAKKAEEVAERKAERERQKQARDAGKAVQLSQRGKRKVSQVVLPRKKQKCSGTAARSQPVVYAPSPTPPKTKKSSRGRKIKPRKVWQVSK